MIIKERDVIRNVAVSMFFLLTNNGKLGILLHVLSDKQIINFFEKKELTKQMTNDIITKSSKTKQLNKLIH